VTASIIIHWGREYNNLRETLNDGHDNPLPHHNIAHHTIKNIKQKRSTRYMSSDALAPTEA